jgi:D-3-phosphoglycerate dehydrogenase
VKALVALSEFCARDTRPRNALIEAGLQVQENDAGRRLRRDELIEALRDVDVVLAGVEPYDEGVLAEAPSLRCISRCGAGTDSIDLPAAAARGIAVLTTPDEVVEPVAQLTVAMMLALARNLHVHAADAHEGHWRKLTGALMDEWTVGLVGFGRIGQRVESYLRPFGPRVLVHDPAAVEERLPAAVELMGLTRLLNESDVVSLHASPRADATALLGPPELEAMKPGSVLVNTARGSLVDEAALLKALAGGHLRGAALDVYQREPYAGPLAALPQVICTPHVATLTASSRAAMELRCARNAVSFLSTHPA